MSDLISIKQSTRYPDLFVHKYKRKVFYDNLWNTDPKLLESRGHVYDSAGNLVVNAPTKVFNYLENGTAIDPSEECIVVHKINGFMACLTYSSELDDVIVSTTGSLDSIFVQRACDYLQYALQYIKNSKQPVTYFFEICHHEDPHIIPENIGAYLLGGRLLSVRNPYCTSKLDQEYLDNLARSFRVSRPLWCVTTFASALEAVKHIKHEGFMVYGCESGTVLKLKSPYYLALKAIARKADILTLSRNHVDEEFYPLLDHLTSLGSSFNDLPEQDRLAYIRTWLLNH